MNNTTCDKCGKQIIQKIYRIALPKNGVTANLCDTCADDVEAFVFGTEVQEEQGKQESQYE